MSKSKSEHRTELLALRRAEYRSGAVTARELDRKRRHPFLVRAQLIRQGMKARAQERGLPFDEKFFNVPTLMVWLANNPTCPCCGRALDFALRASKGPRDSSPSVDRVVPNRGYVADNVAILCWRCNNLKRDATPQELEQVARWFRGALARRGIEAVHA